MSFVFTYFYIEMNIYAEGETMKCHNCKKDTKSAYEFCEELYCHNCLEEYVHDECMDDAIELWIEQNTTLKYDHR